MNIIKILQDEFEREVNTTRKFLSIVPEDKFDWKPHSKSMSLKELASHVAEIPGWIPMTLQDDGLDFASTPYTSPAVNNTKELVAFFEKAVVDGRDALSKTTEEQLMENWTMRSGEVVYETAPKYKFLRDVYCQTTHHRAQLGVYLRLNNIAIPGSYGPSADELGM